MEHQVVDEAAKPSEKVIQQHAQVATTAWQDFDEDEQPLVPLSTLMKSLTFVSDPPGHTPTRGGGGCGSVPKPRAGGGRTSAKAKAAPPNVEAARQRAKTATEWKRIESAVQKAMTVGEHVLNEEAIKVHLTPENVATDCSLDLLRQRMALLKVAMCRDTGVESAEKSKQLYTMCLSDPYLKDLSTTLLAVEDGCQTLGAALRCRDTLLDIQPTAAKVTELMDNHRNAMSLLKTIATCVHTEAESWKANIQALIKAKADEKKALEKAAEKERKLEAQKQKREEAAKQKKLDAEKKKQEKLQQEAKAKAAAAETEEQGPDGGGADGKARRVRCSKGHELSESDPPILHELRSSQLVVPTTRSDDVAGFITAIAMDPDAPTIARLRKASCKKILNVTWL